MTCRDTLLHLKVDQGRPGRAGSSRRCPTTRSSSVQRACECEQWARAWQRSRSHWPMSVPPPRGAESAVLPRRESHARKDGLHGQAYQPEAEQAERPLGLPAVVSSQAWRSAGTVWRQRTARSLHWCEDAAAGCLSDETFRSSLVGNSTTRSR